jgi:pyruvate/2-oxoglutarate dehydrogenase complex dihydrolipoamide dehydrogenase (E3) component
MDTFDFVIIGAGPAGESAAGEARRRGATVAVIDKRWFGGSCPHIGCLPSKSLLADAARHHANAAAVAWPRASAHRDFMINRAADAPEPDDSSHVTALTKAGAVVYRGSGMIAGLGRVAVTHDDVTHELAGTNVVIAVGSVSKRPPIEGLDEVATWTNEEATLTRELPRTLVVLGGGPTGCELAQVYARFGVPTTIVQSGPRLAPTDHPRNSEVLRATLEDGSTAAGHVVILAVGRSFPIDDLGLEHYGIDTTGRTPFQRDGRLRVADGLWVIGDPAGPELHTHQAHYQGELAVRMALGEPLMPDYRALPRATYTEPEASSVGVTLQEALDRGLDAFELVADFAKSTRGYALEATWGHITIVVDRRSRQLVGAAMACPDASAAIHECVLAIKARVPIDVLADTIHAFPSTSRSFQGLFADALKELDRAQAATQTP